MFFRALTIGLLLSLAAPAWAGPTSPSDGSCAGLLQNFRVPTASYKLEDWQNAYRESKIRGNHPGAAWALANLLYLKRAELGLSFPSAIALKTYRKGLGNPEIATGQELPNPSPSADTLGNPIPITYRLSRGGAAVVRETLWSMGPFVYRLIPHFIKKFSVRFLVKDIEGKVFSNPAAGKILGISDDRYLRDLSATYFQDPKFIRRAVARTRMGILAMPMLVLGMSQLLEMAVEQHGGDLKLSPVSAYADELHPDYSQDEYLKDLQRVTGRSLKDKKVFYIVDRDFLSKVQDAEENPEHVDASRLVQVQAIRKQASEFRAEEVGSVEELNTALDHAGDADFVLVNMHGLPGDFVFGQQPEYLSNGLAKIHPRPLKKGATLVFISCSFGDRFVYDDPRESEETWVQLSQKVLGEDGVAVASTNDILFFDVLTPPPGAPSDAPKQTLYRKPYRILLHNAEKLGQQMVFVPWDDAQAILNAHKHVYGSRHVGFRTYESGTGTVTYHRKK